MNLVNYIHEELEFFLFFVCFGGQFSFSLKSKGKKYQFVWDHCGFINRVDSTNTELIIPELEIWYCIPYLFFLRDFLFFNWSIVDLQCCVNFYCIAKWFSYTYIYILFHILFHYGISQEIEYSSLCYTVGPCCLSILYILVCIC